MRSKINRDIRNSLLLSEDDIRSIQAFLEREYNFVDITAKCNEGTTLDECGIADIIAFPNLNSRRIVSVDWSASPSDRWSDREHARLSINADRWIPGASLTIVSTDDKKALYVAHELTLLLREMRPSHDWFARHSLFEFAGAIAVLLVLLAPEGLTAHATWIERALAGLLLVVPYVGSIWLLDRGRRWLFPRVFFLIGRQRQEYDRRSAWRQHLFATLLLGVVASLVAGIILSYPWK